MPERIAAAEREIADLQQKVDALRQSQAQPGGQAWAMGAPLDLKVGLLRCCPALWRWGQAWRLQRSLGCNALSPVPGGLCFRRHMSSDMSQTECSGLTGKLLKGGASAVVLELRLQFFQGELRIPKHPPLQSLTASLAWCCTSTAHSIAAGALSLPLGGWGPLPTQAGWCCPWPCLPLICPPAAGLLPAGP